MYLCTYIMETLFLHNSKNTICRTCLKPSRKFFDIFTHVENERSIITMLMDCVTIKVEIDDGLPVNICSLCLRKLSSACDFKTMTIDSDFRLRSYYSIASTEGSKQASVTTGSVQVKNGDGVSVHYKNKVVTNEKLNPVIDDSCDKSANSNIDSAPASFSMQQDNEGVRNEDGRNYNASVICKDKNVLKLNERDSLNEILLSPLVELIEDDQHFFENNTEESSEKDGVKAPDYVKRKVNLTKKEQDQKTLLCKYCNKLFSFRYYFDIHVHQHTGNTPFKCELCDKRFVKRSMLNKHKQIHSDSKPYQCNVCGKRFKYLSNVNNHMVIHSEQKPYKCIICNKGFKVPGGLKIHIRRHTGERPYICEVCGKSFISQGDLALHIGTHNTTKNFTCPKCGKSFANKMSLRVHLKRHSDNKPYTCDRCNKSFSTNAILQHHILIHTGAKPYSCNVCGKSFRQSACIPRHMRIHTGETPYPCEQCESKFKYKHHLLNHMKKHM